MEPILVDALYGTRDAYHSDVFDLNSTSPTLLRMVGFGNNSQILGSEQTVAPRPGSALAAFFGVIAFIVFIKGVRTPLDVSFRVAHSTNPMAQIQSITLL